MNMEENAVSAVETRAWQLHGCTCLNCGKQNHFVWAHERPKATKNGVHFAEDREGEDEGEQVLCQRHKAQLAEKELEVADPEVSAQ